MSQVLWEGMVAINTILSPLRVADTKPELSMTELVAIRSRLRAELDQLRTTLGELYSEREAYAILFPITAHCDELVRKLLLETSHLAWPSLQQELYQVADAGDLFFELLDSALGKPETLPLVYETYYFCLQDGFCGRYITHLERIADYLQKLRKHIPVMAIAEEIGTNEAPQKKAYFRIPNYFYYTGAVLIVLMIYFFLTNLASSWEP
jgi:type IV/VI secretion system ImpK/VasF family protein